MRYCRSLFNRANCEILFRVGLCSHGITVLQVTWRHHDRRTRSRGVDRVDRSSRDRNHNTCGNFNLSETGLPLIWRHVDSLEVLDLHQTATDGTTQSLVSSSDHDCHRGGRN